MTTVKHLAIAVSLILACSVLCLAQEEQQPTVEMTSDNYRVRFEAQGEVQQVRVEIFSPLGEKVFDSGAVTGVDVSWDMRDRRGGRVPEGVYLASVTITDAAGVARKRSEQINVGSPYQGKEMAVAASAPNNAVAPINGEGTTGKIAKFTGVNAIGNSVITESAGKVGVATTVAPTAILQIEGPQPAAVAGLGTNATTLLQTTGGKGGNTTGSGQKGGKGASIALLSGNGGNAVAGATNGSGGAITLQPGSAGTGGVGGLAGYVLLAPTVGNVGVGTDTPTSKLAVRGSADNTLVSVVNSSTNANSSGIVGSGAGTGVLGTSGGVGAGVTGRSTSGIGVRGEGGDSGVLGTSTSSSSNRGGVQGFCAGGCSGVIGQSGHGYGVFGKSTGTAVFGESTDQEGVFGKSESGIGVSGVSTSFYGVYGRSTTGYSGYFDGVVGVKGTVEIGGNVLFGSTTRQMLFLYGGLYTIGVQSQTQYYRTNGGFAWFRGGTHSNTQNNPGTGGTVLMRLSSAGNVTATSFNPTSDRNAKANFSAVNPRHVLDRLASLPIKTWNYKVEDTNVRHIGPAAQDFRAAFDLGSDDKSISTVDADGVTMAAIQGLYQMMQEKERKNEQLSEEVRQLRAQLMRLERAIGKRATKGKRRR
jgi:Chaperone of endosialidase